MNILFVTPSFFPATVYGGPIFSTLHTSKELAKLDNVEVRVSTTNANMNSKLDILTNKWQKIGDSLSVKYYDDTFVDRLSLPMLFFVWRDIKVCDVVNIQYVFSSTTPIALFFAKIFNKRIILSPRGALRQWCLGQGSSYKLLWLRWLIRPFVGKIIWHATSQGEKDDILVQFPNTKVEVIPNGVDYLSFQTYTVLSSKSFCKIFAGKEIVADKIIISMGRLQKVKGFDILIDAFNKILVLHPDAILFIAGEDEKEGENLRKQVSDLGLGKKVFFVGAVYDQSKIDFFANADLFVLPSHSENFGNVYVESLAAGTPVIASRGTPWEEVEVFNCGKWVPNTVDDFAKAMVEVLKNETEGIRRNSKKLAKKYDWREIAVKFKSVFDEVDKKDSQNTHNS